MASVALNTSVIVEYIDLNGPFHEQAKAIVEAIASGKLEAVIPHPVVVETFYVAARIYTSIGARDPLARASRLVGWLNRLSTVGIAGETLEIALEAGRAKLKYRLALTDCYVLAAFKVYRQRRSSGDVGEMKARGVVESLSRGYDIVFLEDYA